MNQQTLKGNWNEIKGKVRSKWGQLTDNELEQFQGDTDKLIGFVQRKTGETRSAVEQFFNDLTADGASGISQVAENVRHYAQDAAQGAVQYAQGAAEQVQHTYDQAAESVRHGYEETEQMVRQRPVESVAICFGAGILAGLLLGLTLRRS